MKLAIPLGLQTVAMRVSQTFPDIRLSLRTTDAAEARARQGAVAAYLAGVWQSVRDGPRSLSADTFKADVDCSSLKNPGPAS